MVASAAPAILVVDDEPAIQNVVARQLRALGYRVSTAGSADAALEVLAEAGEPYSLLLLDIVMRGMDGFQLARQVLAQGDAPAIVMMSAYAPERTHVLELGADRISVLRKPFGAGALAGAVDGAIRRPATTASSTLCS